MHINIAALRKVLRELSIPFSEIEGFPDALLVNGRPFIRAATPFNSEAVSVLCRDKAAIYKILEGKVRQPQTKAFIDPSGGRPELCDARSIEEIASKSSGFLYPRVVKMNVGEGGINVFVANDEAQAVLALRAIFDRSSRHYDYIALVQEYVEPTFEYRVAVSAGKPAFAYARGAFEKLEGPKQDELFALARTVIREIGLSWGALDFIESKQGDVYFLEANTRPLYGGFVAKNGDDSLVGLYKTALCESRSWDTISNTLTGSSSRLSSARLS